MMKEVEVEDDLTIEGPTVRKSSPGRTESPLGNAAVAQDDSSAHRGHLSTDLAVKDSVERYDASADLGHTKSSTDCSEIYLNSGLIAHAPSALPVRKGPVDDISHTTDLGHAESSALRCGHLKTTKPSDFVAESSAVPASKGPVRASTHVESSAVHSAFTDPSSPVRARASGMISIPDLVPHGSPSRFVAAFSGHGGFVSRYYLPVDPPADGPSALPVRKGPVDDISHTTDLGHAESSALRCGHLKTTKPSDFVAESSADPASKGPVRASTHVESSAVHSAFTDPSSPVRARASGMISIPDLVPHGSPSRFVAAFSGHGGFVSRYYLPVDPPADDSDDELLKLITEENLNFALYTDDDEPPLPSTSSTASSSLPPAGTDTGAASLPDGQDEDN